MAMESQSTIKTDVVSTASSCCLEQALENNLLLLEAASRHPSPSQNNLTLSGMSTGSQLQHIMAQSIIAAAQAANVRALEQQR
jgi:hypothetical protein